MRRSGFTLTSALAAICVFLATGSASARHSGNDGTGGGDESRGPGKRIAVRDTDRAPKIDGVIEGLWSAADSVSDFVQNQPYEKTAPTERTVVYLMQDEENLYVAFRCHAAKHPPTACYTKDEDYVSIAIDPFGSRTTGYFFLVYGSGLFWDGLTLDDGRDQDLSWEGVWTHALRIRPDRMEVEMKIPFKTIRYRQGLSNWGIQFHRHIASNFEDDYWTEVPQKEGDLVSRWGTATEVEPQSTGYYFELYPEGFTRYDDYRGQSAKVKPKGSLNLKWDFTPQTSLNATAYPDFAQIESDPFSVNLSRYPSYLQEQRPFFVEGTEIFRFSSFSHSGFFQPLNIFYSRRIGKSIDGEAVPIVGGVKLTHKTADWNVGALGAFTDSYRKPTEGIFEPQRRFGVVRAKRRVFGNSDVGLLATGTSVGSGNYNYAFGADAGLRRGGNQMILQGGMSNRNGKQGWAVSTGYRGFNGHFLTLGTFEAVGDSFDVADIGFVPWTGRQRVMVISGPFWQFRKGAMNNLYLAPGIIRSRDPGSPYWSTVAYALFNPSFRGNWGLDLEGSWGRNYEFDDRTGSFFGYYAPNVSASFWGVLGGNHIEGSCNYGNSYNYLRHYLAWQGSNSFSFSYSFSSPLSAGISSNLWVEWDPQHRVVALTPRFRPRVDYRINAVMSVSVFNEMVAATPEARVSKTRLQSDRLGFLYSWNFAPKSWFYAALNDFNSLEATPRRPGGEMRQQYAIGAVKLKYLLYF